MSRLLAASLVAISVAAGLGAFATARAAEPEPPAGIAWYVLNEINGFYLDNDDPTNRPPLMTEIPEGVLVPVEVSHDGIADWLINWPDSTQFCGTGGCARTLYVSDPFEGGEVSDVEGNVRPHGFIRAFDRQGGTLDIRETDGEVRVESSFHHLYCDDLKDECRLAWAWDPQTRELVERPSSDGVHIVRAPSQPAIDLGEEEGRPVLPRNVPQAVFEIYEAGRRVCVSDDLEDGVSITWPTVAATPDLNGDGARDWVIGPPTACLDTEATPYAFQVWVTSGPAEPSGAPAPVTLAFESRGAHWAHVDVASRPARLIESSSCEWGRECPGTTLRWDAATRRLVP